MAQSDITYAKVSIDDQQESGNPDPISMFKSLFGGRPTAAPAPAPSAQEQQQLLQEQRGQQAQQAQQAQEPNGAALKPIPQLGALQQRLSSLTPEQKQEAEEHAAKMQEMVEAKLAAMPPAQRAMFLKKQELMSQAILAQMKQGGAQQQQQQEGGPAEDGEELERPVVSKYSNNRDAPSPQVQATAQGQSLRDKRDSAVLFAIRSGQVDLLAKLLEEHDMSPNGSVRAPTDQDSHPLLHWAALNDQKEVVQFLADRDADLDQRNPRGEVALHWASLNGNLRVVHELIERGCDRTASDARGYSAMHHAAQFGRTVVLACLLRRGLNIDIRDNNGRTPLHWAAYKGEDMCAQWLLDHGADLWAEDFEQCLPLHWAALQGLYTTCAALMKNGAVAQLDKKDRTGGTPAELAREKQHQYAAGTQQFSMFQHVADYLTLCKRKGQDVSAINSRARHPTWYAWPVLAPIGIWQYYTVVMPHTFYYPLLTLIFVLFYAAEWFAWISLQLKDPGAYVQAKDGSAKGAARGDAGSGDSSSGGSGGGGSGGGGSGGGKSETRITIGGDSDADEAASRPNPNQENAQLYRDMYYEVLDNGLLVPVCTSCEIVKPLRSKHDRFTDVCVARFDHYCPFMGVAIGENNYRTFFFAMFNAMICMWAWLYMVVLYTGSYNKAHSWWENFAETWYWQMFAWLYLPIALYATLMVAQHLFFIKKNLTTNEVINRNRYQYLANKRNPFDQGTLYNFLEFLGVHKPVRMSERDYYRFFFEGRSEQVERHNHSLVTGQPMIAPPRAKKCCGGGGGGGHGHAH